MRLLIVVIDAVEPTLLRRWAADRTLPNIRELIDRGTSGEVRGVEGLIHSTWPSFYTGLNPAGHGVYRASQLDSGSYEFFRPRDRPDGTGGTPLWTLASDAGRRVAVVDAQLSRLDQNVNGVHVVGWGDFENPPYATSPPTLAAEIAAAVGDYPLSDVLDHRRTTVEEFGHLVASLELGVEKKTALALELLDREDWDLFVHTFTEGHCVGHQCWHLHDPGSPSHDPKVAAKIGDPVERVYRALDRGVGTVIERAGDARVLVLSLHGMSSWRGAGMLLDEILYRLDATARPAVEQTPRLRELLYRMRVTDNPVYNRVRARRAGERSPYREPRDVLGWADVRASRCFTVPTGFPVAGIRLNLVGREPEGILRRGSDADAFCEWLSGELLAIVDERTGTPLVAAIRRTEDIYAGPRLDALPDLLVEWNAEPTGTLDHAGGRGATVRARSESIGVVVGENRYHRTGDHLPSGFFVYTGHGVPVGERAEPVELTDFYPTICALLGLPIPEVDGGLIRELVFPTGFAN